MNLSSSAFVDGASIPAPYSYHGVEGGKNISLPLQWSDAPAETQSFALSIVDPHPVAKNWVHWFVVDIPPATTLIAAGASLASMPPGSRELFNTYGKHGYGGPEPPKGSGAHPYVVTLYALNVPALHLPEKTTLPDFLKTLQGKIITEATVTGMFER